MTELRKLEKRLWELEDAIAERSGRCCEVVGLVILVMWGVWLLAPTETFASSRMYLPMARFAREELWGAAALAFGASGLLGWRDGSKTARLLGAVAAGVFYGFVALAVGAGSVASTGVPVYGVLAVWQMFLSYRIAGER